EDVARTDGEGRTRFGFKLERTRKGYDVARDRILVPFERTARGRLTEGDVLRRSRLADEIAAFALGEGEATFLEQRVAVGTRPHPHASDHDPPLPFTRQPGRCRPC